MANAKRNGDSTGEAMGDMKPSRAKRAVKAGVIIAAAGLTALAISRRMKSRKAKAAGNKRARPARKRATPGARRKSTAR